MGIRGDRRNTGGGFKKWVSQTGHKCSRMQAKYFGQSVSNTCKQLPENLRVELKKLGLLKYQMARLNYWGKCP